MRQAVDIAAIEAIDLEKRYGSVVAVSGLNLSVRRGEIFGIVGADGAGKTTTIQMLCSLLLPFAGEARVLGKDTVRQPDEIKARIGYMSERFNLYPTLTVTENLEFFARIRGVPPRVAAERKEELLRFSRLGPFQRRLAEHLSGGMQKKLALCCTLIHQPEVIFLDEPTTGVDPVSRRDFWRILSRFLAKGITVFVSTPYLDEAERFSRVALMYRGKIIASDTPERLKASLAAELLEIRAAPPDKALAILKATPDTGSAQVFGDSIHVLVDSAEKTIPLVRRALAEGGVSIEGIGRIAPTLEDVFVAALGSLQEPESRAQPHTFPSALAEKAPAEPAVAVSDVTRRFGEFTAVDRVTFAVSRGEIFGLLGPNGSGKTTTIRLLCGLLRPTSGSATVLGQDMAISPQRARGRMGYMSQKFSLLPDLTAEENINFYGGLYGLRGIRLAERKKWVLDMAGLAGKERLLTRELSGGWKQRLALGCTLLHSPEVIFLDEPTAGMDALTRRGVWELIRALAARGTAIVITTHYMDEAEHCHRLGLMHQGRLVAMGTPSHLKTGVAKGELIEVVCADLSAASELLAKQPAYSQVSLFGNTIHVVVASAAQSAPEIRSLLETKGIAVHGIRQIPFTLEDVFISLVEEMEVSGTPAGTKGA